MHGLCSSLLCSLFVGDFDWSQTEFMKGNDCIGGGGKGKLTSRWVCSSSSSSKMLYHIYYYYLELESPLSLSLSLLSFFCFAFFLIDYNLSIGIVPYFLVLQSPTIIYCKVWV